MDSKDKKFSIDEAVKIITDEASKKFVEAIDVAVNLGIDPVKSDQAVRGATNLPHGNGKTYKVAVFAEGDEAKEAKDAGADKVGMEDLAEDLKKGIIDFVRVCSRFEKASETGIILIPFITSLSNSDTSLKFS